MFEVGENVEVVAQPGSSLAYDINNSSLCPGPAVVVATSTSGLVEISFPGTCDKTHVVYESTLKHCYGYAIIEWFSKDRYGLRGVYDTRKSAETALEAWAFGNTPRNTETWFNRFLICEVQAIIRPVCKPATIKLVPASVNKD